MGEYWAEAEKALGAKGENLQSMGPNDEGKEVQQVQIAAPGKDAPIVYFVIGEEKVQVQTLEKGEGSMPIVVQFSYGHSAMGGSEPAKQWLCNYGEDEQCSKRGSETSVVFGAKSSSASEQITFMSDPGSEVTHGWVENATDHKAMFTKDGSVQIMAKIGPFEVIHIASSGQVFAKAAGADGTDGSSPDLARQSSSDPPTVDEAEALVKELEDLKALVLSKLDAVKSAAEAAEVLVGDAKQAAGETGYNAALFRLPRSLYPRLGRYGKITE